MTVYMLALLNATHDLTHKQTTTLTITVRI